MTKLTLRTSEVGWIKAEGRIHRNAKISCGWWLVDTLRFIHPTIL